ncbi:MAG: ABC transporter permease subunit [Oscillospiraceae bacterium]|nr:ABC transporter permease subunit [Oscillospiraceae bacterium]
MRAIYKHELSSHFTSLSGYVFGAFLLLFTGIYMLSYNLSMYYTNFEVVLGGMSFIFMVLVPILTMRVLAEERRQKTDQLLYSLPISMTDVVLGKFFAMLTVFAIPMVIICLYPLILSAYGNVHMPLAYGAIVGFFLLGAALIAMGTFVSSVTENQAVSAGLCFVVMLINYFISSIASLISASAGASLGAVTVVVILVAVVVYLFTKNATVALTVAVVAEAAALLVYMLKPALYEGLMPNVLKALSLYERFYSLLNGVLDITSIVYYISVTGAFLYLSVQSMEKRRWSE